MILIFLKEVYLVLQMKLYILIEVYLNSHQSLPQMVFKVYLNSHQSLPQMAFKVYLNSHRTLP